MSLRGRRGRFAPSPTGPLHFGSLIAAIASMCDARARGGEWLLRIEDVDVPRNHPGAEASILRTLARYGFNWDGPVLHQTSRASRYQLALDTLVERQLAFACACTRRELECLPQGAGGERVYPGTCRHGVPIDRASRRQRAWRFVVGDGIVEYRDRLQGLQRQDLARDVGDFVVRRADGLFAYQLAVVVDDAEQQVTDVVRGADLLASTPRQIRLQQALGFPALEYLHVPVAVNGAGEKLAKQTRARALPDDALPVLRTAWRFLEQPEPLATPRNVAEFWDHAIRAWTPKRLPPVAMLPAPRRFGATGARDPDV